MSLKITVEVDGQTEQQLAPVVAQFVASHPEWLGMGTPEKAPGLSHTRDFYHDNSALLQQHIQQLTAQNERLQAQVTHSQRLLAGVPQAKALSPGAADSQEAVTASAVSVAHDTSAAPPPLPVQYQLTQGEVLRDRCQRLVVQLPAKLWQALIWLAFGKEWLLLFLLFCGGMYGTLTLAPLLSDRLWPLPEFVDSAENRPGTVATPELTSESPEPKEKAPATAQPPALPTSKAGSHPPPPPAFLQP